MIDILGRNKYEKRIEELEAANRALNRNYQELAEYQSMKEKLLEETNNLLYRKIEQLQAQLDFYRGIGICEKKDGE